MRWKLMIYESNFDIYCVSNSYRPMGFETFKISIFIRWITQQTSDVLKFYQILATIMVLLLLNHAYSSSKMYFEVLQIVQPVELLINKMWWIANLVDNMSAKSNNPPNGPQNVFLIAEVGLQQCFIDYLFGKLNSIHKLCFGG